MKILHHLAKFNCAARRGLPNPSVWTSDEKVLVKLATDNHVRIKSKEDTQTFQQRFCSHSKCVLLFNLWCITLLFFFRVNSSMSVHYFMHPEVSLLYFPYFNFNGG